MAPNETTVERQTSPASPPASAGSIPQGSAQPAPASEDSGTNELQLPLEIINQMDVARICREIESIGDFLTQTKLRTPGTPTNLPRTSRLLDEFMNINKLNLLQADEHAQAKHFFDALKTSAPVLHMSFAVDPSAQVMQKIIAWLRHEIHPHVLLQTGLQPGLGAGFILRTPNRYIDCSLRQNFMDRRDQLVGALRLPPAEVAS